MIAATFEEVRSRHSATVENLADIIIGLRQIEEFKLQLSSSTPLNHDDNDSTETSTTRTIIDTNLVDSFLKDRLGIQLLCDHYVAIDKYAKKRNPAKIGGGISVNCNFMDVLNDAILEAKHVCDANLGTAPEVYVVYDNNNETLINSGLIDDAMIRLTLIRPWVHHVLVETLKNAMSSNVEKFLQNDTIDNSDNNASSSTTINQPPNIYVRIHDSDESLTCEIMDQGVGLTDVSGVTHEDDKFEKVFQFAFSTSRQRWDRLDEQQSYAMVRSPLGSLGVGLTLSRMMIQMFGGDLFLSPRSNGYIIECDNDEESKDQSIVLESGCTATIVLNRDPTILEWDQSQV